MSKVRAATIAACIAIALFLSTKCEAKGKLKIITEAERVYKLDTEISYRMVDPIINFIVQANAESESEPITIVLDSPGGSVLAGAKILDYLRASKAPTHCVVDNFAASMAAMILENCTKRYATPSAVIMFHNASGEFKGPFPQVESRFNAFKKLVSGMELSVAKRLNMKLKDYQTRIAPEWWIMGSAEAIKFGVVDGEALVKIAPMDMRKKRSIFDRLFGVRYINTKSTKDFREIIRPFELAPFIESLIMDTDEQRQIKKDLPNK